MKTCITLLCLLGSCLFLSAQTNLNGKVTDKDSGEPIIFANVVLYQNDVLITGAETDFDGNYYFRSIDPGTYDVEVSYIGYSPSKIAGVKVFAGKSNKLNIQMSAGGVTLDEVVVVEYKVPVIEQDNTTSGKVITMNQFGRSDFGGSSRPRKRNRKKRKKGAANAAGLSSANGSNMNIRGSRSNATDYYIDGVRVSGKKNRETYAKIAENDFVTSNKQAFSTFSIDVDRASYSNVRRFIQTRQVPPKDAVRLEEMINYFPYSHAGPTDSHPFAIHTQNGACPWSKDHQLLYVSLKGQEMDWVSAPISNLIFLIDVSGSMGSEHKLPLVKKSILMLAEKMRPQDQIAIITYGNQAQKVLPFTSANQRETIKEAINKLHSGGGTNGHAGLKMAYELAEKNYLSEGNNRILIATDGDFNIGIFHNPDLKKFVEAERKKRIYISVLGYGMGNYQDSRLEMIADNGNGNYAYIDNLEEAKKVLIEEAGGTLFTIAKDVKIQVEFDSAQVKSYRLLGYENRALEKEDFNNDAKDAGELGAGHSVTAIYQVETRENSYDQLLATVHLRYKFPLENQSYYLKREVLARPGSWEETSEDFRFAAAVAGFGMILRDSPHKGTTTTDEVIRMAQGAMGQDPDKHRQEFVDLVKSYQELKVTASN